MPITTLRIAVVCAVLGLAGHESLSVQAGLPKAAGAYVATGSLATEHATQAAAADERFVYAIGDAVIVKYDRATGKELARSNGKAQHLNSGFLWQGKLLSAHSNYPRKPDESDIRVLDPDTMELKVFHAFTNPPGSLTWVVRRGDHWWCHFAHYRKDNAKSVLVRFDSAWREVRRWTYAPELVADWGNYSLSGGVWLGDDLLATGHDKRVIYHLRVPNGGDVVSLVDVASSPFPGQGIALDPKTGGLIGIDRAKKQIVFAQNKPDLNPREVIERYLAAALAGKVEEAMALAEAGQSPSSKDRIIELKKVLGVKSLFVPNVYASDKAGRATAISVVVKLAEANPGRDQGVLEFALKRIGTTWRLRDIDFRTDKEAETRLQIFRQKHADAKEYPAAKK